METLFHALQAFALVALCVGTIAVIVLVAIGIFDGPDEHPIDTTNKKETDRDSGTSR